MSWFDEQVKQRKISDDEAFNDSFINIASAISGAKIHTSLNDDKIITKNAIDVILKYYRIKSRELPNNIEDMNEQMEYLLRPHGIMRRTVKLPKKWYKDAFGPLICTRKSDGIIVAFIPTGAIGYSYIDPESNKSIKINSKNEDLFEEEAIAFYKPFPLKSMNILSLLKYIWGIISLQDIALTVLITGVVTGIGFLVPIINNIFFGDVVNNESYSLLYSTGIFLICVTVSMTLFSSVKTLINARINTKLYIYIRAATMMRVLSLPIEFFKKYSSGEVSSRTAQISSLSSMLVNTIFSSGLNAVFSLAYLSQIFIYAPALVVPSLIITLLTLIHTVLTSLMQMKISKKQMELIAKEQGMTYALISGIQKIKLSSAEKRVFVRWANLFSQNTKLTYNPPMFLKISPVISMAITIIGNIVLYMAAIKSSVSVADYYAFTSAYGMVSGAFLTLTSITLTMARIKPVLEMVKPIFETIPEITEGKTMVSSVSGKIEISNVSFRYSENMPLVLDNLSLKIKSGQYVAVVGKTGCGKSTLVRLLLGFETPQKGSIYYDGKDLKNLELKSLRRRIGTVMQNGKLFMGDIYSNIIISAPWLTVDDAWKAAKLAGLDADIKHMPMGMNTIISEGSGGVSGGQRQRLMIARAIAPKPKILIFDEATSALDNITQKKVSDSLNTLKCTRIVIAHRLSTIKQCDRIIVLDGGKIVEDGNYEDLIANKGFFAELVKRQQIEEVE